MLRDRRLLGRNRLAARMKSERRRYLFCNCEGNGAIHKSLSYGGVAIRERGTSCGARAAIGGRGFWAQGPMVQGVGGRCFVFGDIHDRMHT
jgi:hypothetical protein